MALCLAAGAAVRRRAETMPTGTESNDPPTLINGVRENGERVNLGFVRCRRMCCQISVKQRLVFQFLFKRISRVFLSQGQPFSAILY